MIVFKLYFSIAYLIYCEIKIIFLSNVINVKCLHNCNSDSYTWFIWTYQFFTDSRNDVEIQKSKEILENIEDDAEDVATVTEGKVFIRKGRIEIVKPGDKETKQKKLKAMSALKRKAEKSVTSKTKKLKKGIDNWVPRTVS